MSSPNKRFIFELAQDKDNQEILEILEDNDFKGNIGLVYTRRPEPLKSFSMEGSDTEILICRDTREDVIAGVAAYTIREHYVNGQIEKVGYLFGLRSRSDYFKKYPLLHRGYAYLKKRLSTHPVNCFISTILSENIYVQDLLEKDRSFMPSYTPFGEYHLFAIKSRARKPKSNLKLIQANDKTIENVLSFINNTGKHYQFFPVLKKENIQKGLYPGLRISDFYYLEDSQKEILVAGSVWNQQSYKQYLVQAYGGWLRILYPISKVFPLFGLPSLPKIGNFLNFYTLSFWSVKNNDSNVFKKFIELLSFEKRSFPFYLIGVHESNPLIKTLESFKHISYKSKLYLVDWKKNNPLSPQLSTKNLPYLECGLL